MYASIYKRNIHTLEAHTYTHRMHTHVHLHGLISIIYLIYRIVTGVSKMRSGYIPIIYILLIRDKSI